ncbi:hypothetical protein N6H14_03760 [Paenibacillus sp. CC-CFT747]|nr:hypothetical protein N6H14_03760 [Paenibacillus sp. CC-CFT747]
MKPEELKQADGKPTIALPEGKVGVSLPARASESIGESGSLTLVKGK